MTTQEAIDYINTHTWSQWRLGLARTKELLHRLGDPQRHLRFVHVAGSNGKGSTCAMIERILREAGYRTGFFPSPYIEDFRERIQVSGEYITTLSGESIYKRFKRKMIRLGYPDATFHDLRHLNASVMLMLGIPDKYAMERGGWSNTATLKNVYQETFTPEREKVDNIIDNYFSTLYSSN